MLFFGPAEFCEGGAVLSCGALGLVDGAGALVVFAGADVVGALEDDAGADVLVSVGVADLDVEELADLDGFWEVRGA